MGTTATKHRVRPPGFTLIELMLAVVIVGALAAIAIPNFLRFQCRAKQKEGAQLAAAVYRAEMAYQAEWGKFLNMSRLTSDGDLDPRSVAAAAYYACWIIAPWDLVACQDTKRRVGEPGWGPNDTWIVFMDGDVWPGYPLGAPVLWTDTCVPPP